MSKNSLIKGLNEDLSAELGTIVRYINQAGYCSGPAGMELRRMFADEIEDEIGHARFLCDAIVDLGGEATTTPRAFEHRDGLKSMLELDIRMEEEDVSHYLKHASMAEELGLIELRMKLEEIAADEAGHARQLQRMLRGL